MDCCALLAINLNGSPGHRRHAPLARCPSQNSKLRQVIHERDAEYRACKEQQRIQPLGMLPNPIALACCDFQCTIYVATRVIRSVNPFRDPKFGIEKEHNIRVRKLSFLPGHIETRSIQEARRCFAEYRCRQTSRAESFRGCDKRSTSPACRSHRTRTTAREIAGGLRKTQTARF